MLSQKQFVEEQLEWSEIEPFHYLYALEIAQHMYKVMK